MIGKLKGIIDSIATDHIILDVNGVGYLVFCSHKVMQSLPRVGEVFQLFIETIVREDDIKLLGFATSQEQAWFKLLTNVQGVGAKVALAILGTLSLSELSAAIATGDKTTLGRTPGVGPKVAVRLTTELKDKIPDFMPSELKILGTLSQDEKSPLQNNAKDAISALVNLGYSQSQAQMSIAKIIQSNEGEIPTQSLIRMALKELAS